MIEDLETIAANASNARPESGPMQFGDDWCGVFLRGDFAGPCASYLRKVLDGKAGVFDRVVVEGLYDMLAGSNQHAGAEKQSMRPFAECLVEMKR